MTVCTANRQCLFGDVADRGMALNEAGRMVEKWWAELANKFPSVKTRQYIVMPNHFHGIVALVGADLCVCPVPRMPDERGAQMPGERGAHTGAPLPQIVQWFKTMTTNGYIRGVKHRGWAPFQGKLWQRNYYEHVIRSQDELDRVRRYILDNPSKWSDDVENPRNKTGSHPTA